MKYCFTCVDGPDGKRLRGEHLQAHLAYIESVMPHLALAGPIVGANGEYIGSLIIYDAETAEAAQSLFAGDPYAQAQVWETVTIHPFKPVAGTLIGGATW
jgi:uncharacterized protein YciI